MSRPKKGIKAARKKWKELAQTKVKLPSEFGRTVSAAQLRMPPTWITDDWQDAFPGYTYEELLAKSEVERPTIDYKGRVAWVPKGEDLYLGRDVEDLDPVGRFSHLSEVLDTLENIEEDYERGVLSERGVNARTLRLRLVLATLWAYHKKFKYALNEKLTPKNVPLLNEKEMRLAVKAISKCRKNHGYKGISWDQFMDLVGKLKYRKSHPSKVQKAARKAAKKRIKKLSKRGSEAWKKMPPEERKKRVPGGES